MNHGEVLTTLAQLSVTLAALSGVAGALSPAATDRPSQRTRILLRDVAGLGLAAALFCMLPLIVTDAAPSEAAAWRWLSAAAGGYWVLVFLVAVPKLARLAPTLRHPLVWAGPLATVIGITSFGWNTLSPGEFAPHRYAAGILCLLGVAGTNFLLALFYPDSSEAGG